MTRCQITIRTSLSAFKEIDFIFRGEKKKWAFDSQGVWWTKRRKGDGWEMKWWREGEREWEEEEPWDKMRRWEVIASIIEKRGQMRKGAGDIKVTPSSFKRSPVMSLQLCLSVMNTHTHTHTHTQLYCTHQAESFLLASVNQCLFNYIVFAIYSVRVVLPTQSVNVKCGADLIALVPWKKKCNFLSKWRGKKVKWASVLVVTVACDLSVSSPLYRSCISDGWMHKWLTCLHICVACSAPLPPFLSLTRPKGCLSARLLSIFLSAFAPRFPLRSPMLRYFFFLFGVISISPVTSSLPFSSWAQRTGILLRIHQPFASFICLIHSPLSRYFPLLFPIVLLIIPSHSFPSLCPLHLIPSS